MKHFLLAFACSAAVAAAAEDKPGTGDKEKIQGAWSVVSGESNGKPVPKAIAKTMKLIFKGDKLTTIKGKDQTKEITFKVDASKKPKEIDVDMDGKTGKGIYELDGDTLKIAHGEIDDPRPKEFPKEAKEGANLTVMVFKRDKP